MPILSKKDKEHNQPISLSRVSEVPSQDRNIFVSTARTSNLLLKLATEPNKFKAIDILIEETPDGKQAYNTYLRLANQGINIELFNRNTNKRVKKYDVELRSFCAKLGVNNSEGLDGILDQLHGSSVAHGGMACEVVVDKNGRDIEDVFLIDPATFTEYKWNENEHRYEIYQQRSDGKKIDLYNGNFFYIPHQPKVGRPDGTLQFLSAVITMTQFYQLFNDSMHILNRIGYPHYNVTIDREALLNSVPTHMKNTPEKQNKLFEDNFNQVRSSLNRIGKDSDIVHFDSNTIDVIGGGVNGAGIDVRAWFEVLEPLIVNSFTMTPVLMGRLTSGSYSLGTVEFKIVTDTVDSMRRGSKRILEEIINLWARVKGYPVYSVVTHNPINWEVQKEKLEVELMKVEKARRAEEYKWISHETAALEGVGAEKAEKLIENLYEYLNHDFREKETETIVPTENIETDEQKETSSENKQRKNKSELKGDKHIVEF